MADRDKAAPEPPTPLARRFVRYLVGFTVGVALGAAPFLGTLHIPGFTALLELYPDELRPTLIPLSAFLMGLVALALQFASGERPSRAYLRRGFTVALLLVLAGFGTLVAIYDDRIIRMYVPAAERHRVEVIAPQRLPPPACPCPVVMTDEECLRETFDPARIPRCWGKAAVNRSKLLLRVGYLVMTCGFGALVALLLLQQEAAQRSRRR